MHWVSTPRYQLQQSLNVLNLTRAHGCLLLQPKFVGLSHDTYIYILIVILIFVHMNTICNIPRGKDFVPYLISMFIFGTSINFYVLMFTVNRSFCTYEFSLSP